MGTYEDINTELRRIGKRTHQYKIVSTMAYLICVREDSLYEGDKHLSCYKRLSVDKNARIIRNLSRARTIIWRNYKELESRSKAGTGLYSANDIMPMALIKELDSDGVSFIKKGSTIPWEHRRACAKGMGDYNGRRRPC